MLVLETIRLKLLPLNTAQLLLLQESRGKLESSLGLRPSAMEMDSEFAAEFADALNFWIDCTQKYPEHYAWFTNWDIILKEKNLVIGGIGLTGLPNEKGEVMTGYLIDKNYHGHGFASEALTGIIEWVFSHKNALAITAETPIENIPSQRLLEKNGFIKTGQIDGNFNWKLLK